MSNNGSTICKTKYLTFITKGIPMLLLCVLSIIIIAFSFIVFSYSTEIPLVLKLMWSIIAFICVLGPIITALNGMIITKKEKIIFIPDVRLKIIKFNEIDKLVMEFYKEDNYKFFATIKIFYKNGKVFIKDYSNQFRDVRKNKFLKYMYTIRKERIDIIQKKVSDIDRCFVFIKN